MLDCMLLLVHLTVCYFLSLEFVTIVFKCICTAISGQAHPGGQHLMGGQWRDRNSG